MRFLIVRLGALGDIVHAIPVAAALRRAFPDARIDWLVSAKHREILDLVPVIDRRLVINDRGDASGGSSFLARSSGAARVIGFSSRYAREAAARLFYTDAHDPGRGGLYDPRETRHVVDINIGLLGVIGVTAGKAEFPIEDVDSAAACAMREQTGG